MEREVSCTCSDHHTLPPYLHQIHFNMNSPIYTSVFKMVSSLLVFRPKIWRLKTVFVQKSGIEYMTSLLCLTCQWVSWLTTWETLPSTSNGPLSQSFTESAGHAAALLCRKMRVVLGCSIKVETKATLHRQMCDFRLSDVCRYAYRPEKRSGGCNTETVGP